MTGTRRAAHSAQEGLTAVIEKRPDIVILDLGLPDGDGIQIVKSIREWSKIPIIIMSGRIDDEDKVKALDAGADDASAYYGYFCGLHSFSSGVPPLSGASSAATRAST